MIMIMISDYIFEVFPFFIFKAVRYYCRYYHRLGRYSTRTLASPLVNCWTLNTASLLG